MLWQIPNWTPNNSVLLAEWVYDNYSYEPLEVIVEALKKPAVSEDKVYRLTPDVVTVWIREQLEKESIKLEKEHLRLKESFKEELPVIDYEAFKKRVDEGTALKPDVTKEKPAWMNDPEYQKLKAEANKKWKDDLSRLSTKTEK